MKASVCKLCLLSCFASCLTVISDAKILSWNIPGRTITESSIKGIRGGDGDKETTIDEQTLSASSLATTLGSTEAVSTPAASEDGTFLPGKLIRVAYQGEPGAYSEKATRELLGKQVLAVGRPSFEDCYRAVNSMECDYACLPIENSLGGSIHDNYDLMLRYDLTIIAEHEFRVHHCLLAKDGVKREDIKYAISHPQALAQCDGFLRGLDITPIPTYDTAGSAKMIAQDDKLPPNCTPQNTAAIASDLAGKTYGLKCLNIGIEDDDSNFTRFLLLARKGLTQYLTKEIPSKTSIVFTLPDSPGALYKALACFSLRDIDFSKIESRPTSASLLNFLKFKSQQLGKKTRTQVELPRFRYCFYLDFLASRLDENAQNAISHLREQADFLRILGSYPQKSRLVGPIAQAVEQLNNANVGDDYNPNDFTTTSLPSDFEDRKPLNIGIIGFGRYGRFLAQKFIQKHRVSCLDKDDVSKEAKDLGVDYYQPYETFKFLSHLDVVVLAVPLVNFEEMVNSLPIEGLRGKLVVSVSPLIVHPKSVMLNALGSVSGLDILCGHPMFTPIYTKDFQNPYNAASASSMIAKTSIGATEGNTWDGRPMVYEKVRISNVKRCDKFLSIFKQARCQMVEMPAEQHDETVADAEFVTHLTGRLITGGGSSKDGLLPPTPVVSKEYAALCDVADMTSGDSFDLFFGMYQYNERARNHLTKLRDNLSHIEKQLAAKEAYLLASKEMKHNDRQRLLSETKLLLQEIVQQNNAAENSQILNKLNKSDQGDDNV